MELGEKRLVHLYRFSNATLTHLSMDDTEKTETITFEYKERDGRIVNRWCYYDPQKFREILHRAIIADVSVNILVKRYLKKVAIKDNQETVNSKIVIEEELEDITIISGLYRIGS